MLIIKHVSARIKTRYYGDTFGFSYDFREGLNIISGQNSTGKSSILSCIYYNLGMEQLLGMSQRSILDKCLTSEFVYKNTTYNVLESEIILVIENDKKITAELTRKAFSQGSEDLNVISVKIDNNTEDLFIHANEDHSNKRGFYRWLQEFINIELPKDKDTGKNTLYLQNIFSACFIEQTKGWSDLFSQMPSFNIKDAKRKLVEYLLELDCFSKDLEKDKLLAEKVELINQWDILLKDFEKYELSLSYKISGITNKYEKLGLDKPNKLKLYVTNNNEWIEIDDALKTIVNELDEIRKENRDLEKRNDFNKLSKDRTTLKLKLLNTIRIKSSIEREFASEKVKIDSYKKQLEKLREERLNLIGSNRVDAILSDLTKAESCPLCDSSLYLKSCDHEISKESYNRSLNFITSKISMVNNYLGTFENLEHDYKKDTHYYDDLIFNLRTQLSSIDRDIASNFEKCLSRESIFKEITLSNEVNKYKSLKIEFSELKSALYKLNSHICSISNDIRDIDTSFAHDSEKIERFQNLFRGYLDNFHYTSNNTWQVFIRDKNPYKALPSVFNKATHSYQQIRISSSASDFIRSEWAFYLSLLQISSLHPGVLIFDEPGQHAMSPDSLKQLLKKGSNLKGKQIIFAISKYTKGYAEDKKEQSWEISNLLDCINNYHFIDIDHDKEKLVKNMLS